MSSALASLARTLAGFDRRSRARALEPASGIDFASNDYLALAQSPQLAAAVEHAIARGVPVGASASRLLRGNNPEHEVLEEEAARFFGSERCLYFGSGYSANLALFSVLPRRGDVIVHDELIHASVRGHAAVASSERCCVPLRSSGRR